MSWILNDTFGGQVLEGGNVDDVTSKPVSWHVGDRLLATSRSQMPVPVPMSATLAVGEVRGMLGWMRKPSVLVVSMCCSSSLIRGQDECSVNGTLRLAVLVFLLRGG